MSFKVKVGISNRHIHLTEETYHLLFESDFEKIKDLTQTGEFATNKTVVIKGPKGELSKVRFLGPFRKYNQVEISVSDAHILGVNPPIRKSGDLANSEKIEVIGDKGSIILDNSCIIAQNHIHMNYDDLNTYGVSDNQKVLVHINGEREGILVAHIKASEQGVLDFHIDRDEANAFQLENDEELEVTL